MQIGIGLPATIPGVSGARVLEWARQSESKGFASLGIIDRLVYPNFAPLTTLAAVAGVTGRVRLVTTVLLAPLYRAGVLAKEAATLDVLSGGRLTLGLGVGGREDDFRAAPAEFEDRGRRFEEQLTWMKRIWAGESPTDDVGPVGPAPVQPGGPELLIGGYSPRAIQRVGRWADGFMTGGITNAQFARQLYSQAEKSWQAAGRPGRPRFVGGVYFALGPDADKGMRSALSDYYGEQAEGIINSSPRSKDAVRQTVHDLAGVGMDEIIFWPCLSDLDQIDRLADAIH